MNNTITTIPGKWYAVTSPNGCTVTMEVDGQTLALEMKAPQDVFCAASGKVTVSDNAATVTQTFNLAPSFFKSARGWGQDPIWFQSLHAVLERMLDGTQLELVLTEQGSKLVVHTDRVDDDLLERVRATAEAYLPAGAELVQYNHNMEISWRDINKYAECVTPMDMYAVSPETTKIVDNQFGDIYLTTDYLSDGTWAYPLPKLETTHCGGWAVNVFRNYNLSEFVIELPNLKHWKASISVDDTWKTKRTIVYAPKVERVDSLWETSSTYFFITADNVKRFNDNTFSKNHTQFDFGLPKLQYGQAAFDFAAMNKDSALRILNSIPAYTSGSHPLTIGIHVDHKTDEEVLAAIANAESKGWTMTVQWNGTPTAQASVTYGLRTPPIYARVGEIELPDGTVERVLDWGHYVTDPSGYEEFRSVEAAREYYGLPAEDLTNN